MKLLLNALIFLVVLSLSAVSIADPRIISLAPNLTEILFAIGAGKNIIGTSIDSNYPKAARQIPIVANAGQLDLEAIVAAKPTMIVAWTGGNPINQLDELKSLHIPVYLFQFNSINDITDAMQRLGALTNHQAQAAEQIRIFNKKIAAIKPSTKPIKVFYLLWPSPLMTVGKNSLINQAISLCGGQNIFADISISAPAVNIASVLQRNPAIIIAGFQAKNWKQVWQQWPEISAVKSKRLYYINPDLLQRPGPRFALGVEQLCGILSNVAIPAYARVVY
jgi:ABC-type Fe3+-hydroxamate transport system substrate-binding protein